ncbi:hypothetical protein DH96_02010 [Candidatus Phytoplasma oryzae]|uniref:Uncharacterized protein n=1 Tax=Candidatus Phytoplasma oryzae TaxID=203274 RepID=A0A328ILJ5_9MOLU|nr:hypothetical protein [Candidatus Phytoplasma oryzae]RAM57698.1 hypothetical protein DH96_02010 [Candidatus Phytoplasma oryzae]
MVKSFFKKKSDHIEKDFLTISMDQSIKAWDIFEKEGNFEKIIFKLQQIIAVFDVLIMQEVQV